MSDLLLRQINRFDTSFFFDSESDGQNLLGLEMAAVITVCIHPQRGSVKLSWKACGYQHEQIVQITILQ